MTLCRIVEIAFYDVSILLIKFDLFEFSDKFNAEKWGYFKISRYCNCCT